MICEVKGLHPSESIGVRPSHTMEMYGAPSAVNVSGMDITRPENSLETLSRLFIALMQYMVENPFSSKRNDFIRPTPAQINVPRVRVPKDCPK